MKRMLFMAAAMLMTVCMAEARAQDIDEDLFAEEAAFFAAEEQVVVSASRREQRISEAPVAITALTREEIVRSGAQTIPEALSMVPGVFVQRPSRGDPQVSIRGLINGPPEQGPLMVISRNILVMVDGRPFFNEVYGGTLWANLPITVDDIERIEVVRGPSSPMFGANAVTGVVNIITRDLARLEGFGFKASTAAGFSNDGQMSFMIEDAYRDFAWRLTGERSVIERVSAYDEYDVTKQKWVPARGDRRDFNFAGAMSRPDYNTTRFNLSTYLDINDRDSVKIDAGYTVGAIAQAGNSGDFILTNQHSTNLFLRGKYETRIGPAPTALALSWTRGRIGTNEMRIDDPPTGEDGLGWKSFDIEAQSIVELSDRDTLVAGLNWRKNYTKSGGIFFVDGTEPNNEFLALFLNNEYRFSERWKLITAARYDEFKNPDKSQVSPQAIVMFSPARNLNFRLGYSEAIRNPFLTDTSTYASMSAFREFEQALNALFMQAGSSFEAGTIIWFLGNPNLDFPRIKSLELGSSVTLAEKHSLDLSLFNYKYTDSVVFDNNMFNQNNPTLIGMLTDELNGGNPFSPYYLPGTGGEAKKAGFDLSFKNDPNNIEVLGVELGARLQLARQVKGWAALTYQHTEYANSSIKSVPRFMANFGVSADVGAWRFNLSANYISAVEVLATNVLDRNMDQLSTAPEALCALNPFTGQPCAMDADPARDLQITMAAAATYWCDMYDNANLGGAVRPGICSVVTPATVGAAYQPAGWWTQLLAPGTGAPDIDAFFGAVNAVPGVAVPYPTTAPNAANLEALMAGLAGGTATAADQAFTAELLQFFGWSTTGSGDLTPGQGATVPGVTDVHQLLNGFAQVHGATERIQATSTASSTQTADDYFMVNLRIARDIARKQAEFFVAVENLFNDKHREYPFAMQLERRIVSGFNWRF